MFVYAFNNQDLFKLHTHNVIIIIMTMTMRICTKTENCGIECINLSERRSFYRKLIHKVRIT